MMATPEATPGRGLTRKADRKAEPCLLDALRWYPQAVELLEQAITGDPERP